MTTQKTLSPVEIEAARKLRDSFAAKGVKTDGISDEMLLAMTAHSASAKREAGVKFASASGPDEAACEAARKPVQTVLENTLSDLRESVVDGAPNGTAFEIRGMVRDGSIVAVAHLHRHGKAGALFYGSDGTTWTSDRRPTDRLLDQDGGERLARDHAAAREKAKALGGKGK